MFVCMHIECMQIYEINFRIVSYSVNFLKSYYLSLFTKTKGQFLQRGKDAKKNMIWYK